MAKKKVKRSAQSEAEPLSFEQALARLEQAVGRLEDGQLGLDESLAQYEQGIKYLKQCYRQLESAQRKIELLAGIDQEGRTCIVRTRGNPHAHLILYGSRSRVLWPTHPVI